MTTDHKCVGVAISLMVTSGCYLGAEPPTTSRVGAQAGPISMPSFCGVLDRRCPVPWSAACEPPKSRLGAMLQLCNVFTPSMVFSNICLVLFFWSVSQVLAPLQLRAQSKFLHTVKLNLQVWSA